jgi:hypothetical protein
VISRAWSSLLVTTFLCTVPAFAQEKKVWAEAPPLLTALDNLDYRVCFEYDTHRSHHAENNIDLSFTGHYWEGQDA